MPNSQIEETEAQRSYIIFSKFYDWKESQLRFELKNLIPFPL